MRKLWLFFLILPYSAFLQSEYLGNGFLVEYTGDNISLFLEKFRADTRSKVEFKRLGPTSSYYLITGDHEASLMTYCKNSKDMLNVTPNARLDFRNRPNDTRINQQYYLEVINAFTAWEITTGGNNFNNREIVIGVIDDGYFLDHEDLVENIYSNLDEIAENNKDDDNNGYKDDIRGWNTQTETHIHSVKSHGTNILGVLGARGNNQKGISGINWNIKILPVTTGNFVSDVVQGYQYLLDEKTAYNMSGGTLGSNIVVSNYSGGLNRAFASDFPIWCSMYDKLGAQGVLNAAATTNDAVDIEMVGDMPANCSSPYLIIVNSTNKTDELDPVTGYGSISVDISAPGETILTTDVAAKGLYKTESGTSLATPMLASAAALLYSVKCESFYNLVADDPAGSALKVKKALMENADKKTSLTNKTVSGGRLNIFKAMNALIEANCDKELAPKGALMINQIRYFNKQLFLNYSSPDSKPLAFHIYDSIGKLCFSSSITPPIFGKKVAVVDIPIELPGIYYYAAIVNEQNLSGRGFTSQLPVK